MSQNIHDIYVANPITSNTSTDLMYFGQSPYSAGNDAAMTYANFAAQFALSSAVINPAHGGTGVASPTAHGVLVAEGASAMTPIVLGAGQILIGTTASDPAAATLSAGTGVSISSVSGAITINAVGSGLTWSTVTAGTSSPAVNSGTIANHAATPLVLTLPATAAVGSVIAVQSLAGSGGFTLTANTGQTIQFGNQSSTSGGSWSSTDAGDSMWVVCAVANTTWTAINVISAGLTKA